MILTHVEPPVTGIRINEASTLTYINNECQGAGTLYIADGDIRWLNNSGEGIILQYPDISLFAICTDREKYQEDCVFLFVKDDEPGDDDDDDSDNDYGNEAEIRFAPPDGTNVRTLFDAIQECNKLHPNENDDMMSKDSEEDSEDDDGDNDDMAGDNIFLNGSAGSHIPGQFDDADD